MMQTSLSAKSALRAQQQQLDVIANNIANVNTVGFKSSSVNFKDTLYNTMVRPTDGELLQRGTGVRVSAITKSFALGTPMLTGAPLDFCLTNDGFFTLEDQDGNEVYTRSGAFKLSVEGDGRYLVDSEGRYVMGEGGRIEIPQGDLSSLSVDGSGQLFIRTTAADGTAAATPTAFATLQITSFLNNEGLEAAGSSTFRATAASGEAETVESPEVRVGYLESSNVDMATEMTTLIRAQKAFSFASQAVRTADEMAAMANNMRN
ncbi:MAG TPA: flagellar hook-basal body protein [Feifaniaceae bacterium]|nr:flagellar hook-basal body protein [Feifaniaceae bacterium]